MCTRELKVEGFNYTTNSLITVEAKDMKDFLSNDCFNQEIIFERLLISEDEKNIEINLNAWEYESWFDLFEYCKKCEFSYIKILKEYRSKGYSGLRSLEHMEDECFAIQAFEDDLTNIECEDALYEYLEENNYLDDVSEKWRPYLDKEKILRDWELNNLPVIEIDHNVFAILFRQK